MKAKNPYLLPEDVVPIHYDLNLEPDLENFVFQGLAFVNISIKQKLSKITLHAVDLAINVAGLNGYLAKNITYDKKLETATLEFDKTFMPGDANLILEFTGELNDKMHGFYRTSYEIDGKKYWGAATQFESTDARRSFPCWDEPAKKATFSITLVVPEHMTAVSNMPEIPKSNDLFTEIADKNVFQKSGLKRIVFERTPIMSTYLVCFVAANLKYIEDQDHNGVPLRLYAVPGKEKHGKFAMECDKSSLKFYGERYGIPYKSIAPKKDMIALPDFASGAMENLGAVTYRETAALIDPTNDTAAARERVAEVVMHENAHMWFGDLVTMKWWNGLWLNEGFATFMSHCAMHDKFPEWDVWTGFVANDFRSALHLDSLKNSHPIEIDVKNPYEIREIFDEITYAKGSVVNRMLEQYLGEDYWKGLRLYLKRYSYKNADTVDLWRELEEVSGKPVRDIMAQYTKQPGYPVVTIKSKWRELGEGEGPHGLVLDLNQTRFLSNGAQDKENLQWKIPMSISICGEKPETMLMKKKRSELAVPTAGAYKKPWIKLNVGQNGFYRVAYSDELWEPLVMAVRRGEISAVDRIGLLDDSLALAKAGYMKTSQALDMIVAQENDKDFDGNVWSVVISNLSAIDHILGKQDKTGFAEFAKTMLWPVASTLGWNKKPDEKHTDTLLRSMVIASLGKYSSQATIEEAQIAFEGLLKGNEIDPNLKAAVYALVAENGGEKEFDTLMKIYRATNDAREKERIQVALGSFKSKKMIKKVLQFSLSDAVRKQDWFRIMVMLGRNPEARLITWNFLKENWEDFHKQYEGNLSLLVRTLEGVTSSFVDKENLADIKKFFKAHQLKEARRAMKQVVETIETNIKWRDRALTEIKNWLAKR